MDPINHAIKAIYEAAAHPELWPVALEALCVTVDGWGAQLMGVSKADGGRIAFSYHARLPSEGMLEFLRYYHRIDPRTPLLMAMETGSWMHDHEHLDEDFVANDPFYQNFIIPYGSRYISELKLADDAQGSIILGVLSGGGRAPFDPREREILNSLGWHMREAMRIAGRRLFNRPADLIGRALVQSLPYPLLLLEPDGAIVHASPVAEQALAARRGGFASCGGRLVCNDAALQSAFEARLRQLVEAAPTGMAPGWQPLPAGGVKAIAWLLLVRPDAVMGVFGAGVQVLLLLVDPHAPAAPDAFTLAVAFGLTPAESRVAEGLLRALTPIEIAAQCHVEVSTVRTQIRALMAKTGTQKQGELMLRLGSLPHVLSRPVGVSADIRTRAQP
jgi:DNA-binding CsgD family transcriptional regulator